MSDLQTEKSISIHHTDETIIQSGNHHLYWLWIAIEPIPHSVLGIYISKEKNMLVAEQFIGSLVEKYGKHVVYTDEVQSIQRHVMYWD